MRVYGLDVLFNFYVIRKLTSPNYKYAISKAKLIAWDL